MQRIFTLAALVAMLTAPAFAFEWSGQLVDANCTRGDGTVHACDAGTYTTAFGLVADGNAFLLDAKGNREAVEVMKFRADYATEFPATSPVDVSVIGEKVGKTILVKRIYIK